MANQRFHEELAPAILTGIAGVATLAGILLFREQIPLPRELSRAVGFSVLYAGMALFLWAALHLKSGIGGSVAPRLDSVVTSGPFRLVRHPTYLAMAMAMVGASLVTRSVVGLALAGFVFLPAEIHRARLEERALRERFGRTWQEYASQTGFFVPHVGRDSQQP